MAGTFYEAIKFMIAKFDSKIIFGQAPSSLKPPPKGSAADFQSLLKGKIAESKPLESVVLYYLNRAVEMVLSETKSEADDLFPSPPLPMPQSMEKITALAGRPVQPQQAWVSTEVKASNNLPGEQDFDHIVQEAGRKFGVDPLLVRAVIQTKSGGNPLAVSRAGAKGLMQLMPETADELGVRNPFDPVQNIMGGTRYLRQLLDRYRGDVKLALAAYNWGMGNMESRPGSMPRETRNYIARIEKFYHRYSTA